MILFSRIAEIANIYTEWSINGWIISDLKIASLGRLTFEEDKDQYEKQAHVFCVQIASNGINDLDRSVRFHFKIFS